MSPYRNYCFLDSSRLLQLFQPLLALGSLKGYTAPYRITYYNFSSWDYARMQDPTHRSFVPHKVSELTLGEDLTVKSRTDFVTPVNIPETK